MGTSSGAATSSLADHKAARARSDSKEGRETADRERDIAVSLLNYQMMQNDNKLARLKKAKPSMGVTEEQRTLRQRIAELEEANRSIKPKCDRERAGS